MIKKEDTQDTLLCLVAGLVIAIAFIAIMCGDGRLGLLNLI